MVVRSVSQEKPKPPLSGIVYGEVAYWMALVGVIISIVGMGMYFTSETNYVNSKCLLSSLWAGKDAHTIWEECAKNVPHSHWYLEKLNTGDGVAMLGIALSCLAAVIGVWLSFLTMLKEKERVLFVAMSFIVAAILTASALGIISLKH